LIKDVIKPDEAQFYLLFYRGARNTFSSTQAALLEEDLIFNRKTDNDSGNRCTAYLPNRSFTLFHPFGFAMVLWFPRAGALRRPLGTIYFSFR
jgi:hypothetical protein